MKRQKISVINFLTVLALFPLAGAAVHIWHTNQFLDAAQQATGQVVDFVEHESFSDGKRSRTWAPVVKFTPEGRGPIKFTSSTASSDPSFGRGDRVTIYYSPNNPHDARIDSFWQLWLISVVCLGLGLPMLAFGIFVARGSNPSCRSASDEEAEILRLMKDTTP